MAHGVADVGDGFHVHVVVVQRLGIGCGAHLGQQDTEPPSEFLRAPSLCEKSAEENLGLFHQYSFFLQSKCIFPTDF